jgi:RNA polymerase sigma factor (sigma-70 family)
MGPSDDVLLAGMAAGDGDLAAAFVKRHQARVYGVAVTMVGAHAVAEDIAQETFVRAWKHAPSYDPHRGRVVTWLLGIARHASVDELRRRHDVPVDPATLLDDTAPGDPHDPADAVWIRTVLSDMPRTQATAVVLSVCYGLTAAEIAEREQIPLGTAKTRIRAGLRQLRRRVAVPA